MPPEKSSQNGKVDVHAAHGPLSAPLAFVGPSAIATVVASNVCVWDLEDHSKRYLHSSAYAISKVAGNAARGLVSFSEGGTNPKVYVYSIDPARLMFTLPGVAELEVADLAFSRCGSRLYVLCRATAKRLLVFSTTTGKELPGCEMSLPQRFDKVSVFPGHKDQAALIRSSSVRILRIQKSYETYIAKLQPSSLPADLDLTVSAYSWTAGGHFVFATRQDYLVTMDGLSGAVLHVCQVADSITSITYTRTHLITSHSGSFLKVWLCDTPQLEEATQFTTAPAMDACGSYELCKVCDLDTMGRGKPLESIPIGQVVHIQTTPDYMHILFTTLEGEVWQIPLTDLIEGSGEAVDVPAVPMQFLTWFHTHNVTDMCFIGRSHEVAASVDDGGRLRLWEVTRSTEPKGMQLIRFTSALTSITRDDNGRLVVVGAASGCVHIVNAAGGWRRAQVTDTCRCGEAGVARLCSVTMEGRCLYVAAALFDHKIALMSVNFKTAARDPKVHMYGLLNAIGSIEDISYHFQDVNLESMMPPKLLVVGSCEANSSSTFSAQWVIRTPPIDYEPTGVTIEMDSIQIWSMKLGAHSALEDKVTAVASATRKTIVVGFAGGAIKVYSMPTVAELPSGSHPVAEALSVIEPAHTQLVTRLCVVGDGSCLVSGSMDGSIRRSMLQVEGAPPRQITEFVKQLHNPYHGGTAQVCVNKDASVILTSGGTDGVVVWSELDSQVAIQAPPIEDSEERTASEAVPITEIDDADESIFPIWAPARKGEEKDADKAAEADDPELNAVALAQRKALMVEVESLRKKLRLLVDANAQAPDLEKLDRSEFCVDHEERDSIALTTKERCDALRAQIERDNLARQLIRNRLITEFWNPMLTKGCLICSLKSTLSVANYPERQQSQEEKTVLKKLRIMRQVEMLDSKMVQGSNCPPKLKEDLVLRAGHFATGDEGYIVNWWNHSGAAGAGAGYQRSDTNKDLSGSASAAQFAQAEQGATSADSVQGLLYEPFELLTNSRRRLQIVLLQSLAVEHRRAFNELFRNCQGEKSSTIDQMKEKLSRIRAILVELQIQEEVPEPALLDVEDSEFVLKVKDDEIKAEKWISEAERKAIEEAKQREEERLRLLRENDAGQRALMQMMAGTLKTKKDLSPLEIVLDREPWMDQIAEEDMTDAQKQAFKEYQDKEKALAEEQDKYRKQLDAELKKLRQDVQDLMQQFEGVLKELQHERFVHDAQVFCQELYCVRLQLALLQCVEDDSVLKTTMEEVETANAKLVSAEDALEAFREKAELMREKQDERVRHEKEVASAGTFRAAFANSGLEPEAVGQLLHIFRRRKDATLKGQDTAAKRRKSSHGSNPNLSFTGIGSDQAATQGGTIATMTGGGFLKGFSLDHLSAEEPYVDLGVQSSDGALHDDGLEEEPVEECPEGVDEVNFRKMLDLRRERYQAEAEVMHGNAVLHEMNNLLSYLQKERDDAQDELTRYEQDLNMHRDLMDREHFDIEILFKLKQGQVEVPQAAVVTDYSDAVVITQEVVESRNRRIVELGQEKIGILETIKEFRKKLNLIHWEHKMLALQTKDLEERTKDVHMLRVTKGLQSLLKGGEEGKSKADADLLERKIEHLSSTTAQKEQSLKKQYAINQRAAKMRKMENSMLEKKLRELQQNVIQREHIRRLRAPTGGGASGPSRKEGGKPRVIGGGGQIEENEAEIKAAQAQFREVKIRTGLMDVVKRHTEEIELLRKELDRLRQKTFPSFVQLHEDRPSNPDQRA